MEIKIYDHYFPGRDGYIVQIWAVYYGARLYRLAYTSAPHWLAQEVEFEVKRAA